MEGGWTVEWIRSRKGTERAGRRDKATLEHLVLEKT